MEKLKFIDMFAGIGGFHSGLEQAGMQCVGWIEIDKYARKSYLAIHEANDLWTAEDITKVKGDELPHADLWSFGSPCQDLSVAGKVKGLDGERSGLFYEVMRLIDEREESGKGKPEWLLFENVKGALSSRGGKTSLKFSIKWQKEGIISNGECIIPKTTEYHKTVNECTLLDILEKNPGMKYYLKQETAEKVLKSLMA